MFTVALRAFALAGLAVALSATAAHAVPITLYNTGVGAAPGAADPHYTLSGGTATITTIRPGSYLTAPAGSQWIAPQADATHTNASPAIFSFSTTFDLTGLDPSTAVIQGKFSADNQATIYLNGVSTGITTLPVGGPPPTNEDFRQLTPFTINSGFVNGLNTLEFRVTNDPLTPQQAGGINPTALLVSNISGSAAPIPEPASLAVFGMATLTAAGYCWRRKQAVTA